MPADNLFLNRAVVFVSVLVYWGGVLVQARRVRRRIGKSPNLKPRGTKEWLLWAGWLLMLGYYFGSTASSKGKDDTIQTQAKTAQIAGSALGSGEATTVLLPGDQATVEPKADGGTVITKQPGDGA